MATDDAVELAPDAQDGADTDDGGGRREWARERVVNLWRRLPRPSPPPAENVVYAYTVTLLFVAPAVAVAGTVWVAFSTFGGPSAVVAGGLGTTAYALFLTALIVRYESMRTVEVSE